MPLNEEGFISRVSIHHSVSPDAVRTNLRVRSGGDTMAQFSHADFGGMSKAGLCSGTRKELTALLGGGTNCCSAVYTAMQEVNRGEDRVYDRPFDLESHRPYADDFQRSHKILRAVYLTAIAFATVGWLWLMAWLATYLFEATT
jgi:hypothetical protein